MEKLESIAVVDERGQTVAQQEIPTAVQEIKIKPSLLHQVVVAYQANRRATTAHTKTRAEVAGGGRKPWRQKGTGRARHGSIRSPLWVGGGVTFGPRATRNYEQKINKQVKIQALRMVVADRLEQGKITVCQAYPEELKTKTYAAWLKALKLEGKKVIVLLTDSERKAARALKNIPRVELVAVRNVNSYDLLRYPYWLISQSTINLLFKQLFNN
ncbi:MAG: 50S ribosomal protein L4 [Patescibacteria group bacterium]